MNYWACMNLGASEEAGGNRSRLITELDQMTAKGSAIWQFLPFPYPSSADNCWL